jgi:hypothetical protein
LEWIEENGDSGFERAVEIIGASNGHDSVKRDNGDQLFHRLARDIREWTPARRRNSEETYKVELRKHLESLRYALNEEYGESNFDLLVAKCYAIEVKKDPDLAEFDRLFGQVARHLEHQCKVIVLILEATRKDKFDTFVTLIDKYLNVGGNAVEVIRK